MAQVGKIRKTIRTIVITIIVLVVIGLATFLVHNAYEKKVAETNGAPQVFSTNRMLLELWSTYKKDILEPTSLRALQNGTETTSEGQSYTLLRSVWMDDQPTFDTNWNWTKDNMQRPDYLLSWKFGDTGNGKYGILTSEGGQNTASDADTDTAFALLMAAGRWKTASYKWTAIDMIKSIWANEVVIINGKPVMTANNLEKNDKTSVIVDPSYLSPAEYKVFAKVDPTDDWTGLVNNSYNILLSASAQNLDKTSSDGLTPDFIRINRTTGAIQPSPEYDSNYGYDAMRTPFRMALDWDWNKDPRAKQVLATMSYLNTEYRKTQSLDSIYAHDGTVVGDYASPAMYGTAMAYFDIEQPDIANSYYTRNLVTLYNPDTQSWKKQLSYYDDNWAWFGMALHNNQLPDLTELMHV